MNKTTFLFDMDGTLLPMDIDAFTRDYFMSVCNFFKDEIEADTLMKAVKSGTLAMMDDKKDKTNIDAFFEVFNKIVGCNDDKYLKMFEKYYETEFDKLNTVKEKNQNMIEAVKILKDKGFCLAVATNPLFPKIAQIKRLNWAGFNPSDFAYVSSGEEMDCAKPSSKYYKRVLETIEKSADECLMVGNDVEDDMVCPKQMGMTTYLVTDYMINKNNIEYKGLKGDSSEFLQFVKEL